MKIPKDRRHFIIAAAVGVGVLAAGGYWGRSRLLDARAQGSKLKIATIGAGRVSGSLGILFAMNGFQVMSSSSNPEQLKDLVASAGPNAEAGTVADAVAFGDVVLLVVPYTAVEQIGKDYGKQLATKQLVMDVSNPIPRRDGEDFVKKINEQGGAGVVTLRAPRWCGPSTPSVTWRCSRRRTAWASRSACRSPATMPRRSSLPAR
jgi:hypothetical protein